MYSWKWKITQKILRVLRLGRRLLSSLFSSHQLHLHSGKHLVSNQLETQDGKIESNSHITTTVYIVALLSWWHWMTRDENVFKHVSLWASVWQSSLQRHFNGIDEIIVWKQTLVLPGLCPESLCSFPDVPSVKEVWFSGSVPAGSWEDERGSGERKAAFLL